MRRILDGLIFSLVILASGAFLPLIKEGGAREEGVEGASAYSGVLNIVPFLWLAITATVLTIALLGRKLKWSIFQWHFVSLAAFGLLSASWADHPKISLRVSLFMLASLGLLSHYVANYGWAASLRIINAAVATVLVASLLAVAFVPGYGISVGYGHEGKWQGVFNHKNSLGVFCAFGFFMLAWQWLAFRQRIYLAFAVAAIILAIGSQSGSSLVAIASTGLLLLLARLIGARVHKPVAILLLLIILSLSWCAVYISMEYPSFDLFEKDSSFTGRNSIWLFLYLKIYQSPWFGQGLDQLGAMAINDAGEFFSHVGFVVASAHNGFLDAAFSLGLIGLASVTMLLFSSLRAGHDKSFPIMLIFLCMMIIINTFESQLLSFNIFFVAWAFVSLATAQRRTASIPARARVAPARALLSSS